MKKLATATLEAAEWAYLLAHGWTYDKNDYWLPPKGYKGREGRTHYRHGHAVNSQKYYNNQYRGNELK